MIRGNKSSLSQRGQVLSWTNNYMSSISFPQKEMKIDKSTPKSLEERVDHLTTGMENMQKTLDRLVTLYESEKSQTLAEREDVEKLKKDVATAKNREKELEIKVVGMRLQLDIQTSNFTRDKLQWEEEHDQLQKELQRYKSLSQKGLTDNSSTQTTGLFNVIPKSQSVVKDHTRPYRCSNCSELYFDERSLKQQQDKNYCVCSTVKTQFAQRTNFVRPIARGHPLVALKIKEKRAEHMNQAVLPIKKVVSREYAESQQSQKNAEPKERHEQKSEQKVQGPVVAQSDHSSIPSPSAPESKAQMTNPPSHPTVDHSKPNARQQLASLLEKHDCKHSECSILAFQNCMQHSTECAIGNRCSWYICNRMHARTEHLKVCDDKSRCTLCQGPMFVNEHRIREMVTLLENSCPLNCTSSYPMNASTRRAITDLAVRLAVNYGLVGDSSEKTVDAETTQLRYMADCEPVSSSGSSFDAGESSEEERTSEEWEIVESE